LLAEIPQDEVGDFSMIVLRTDVWIAVGMHLFLISGGKMQRHWRCESPILNLIASTPFLPRSVVACCLRGVAVFWHDRLSDGVEMLAADFERPRATFLGNGMLVLLDRSGSTPNGSGRVFDLDRNGIHGAVDFEIPGGREPVGVVATDRPNEFGVFSNDCVVRIWSVSPVRKG
jgi:hypothetical protein